MAYLALLLLLFDFTWQPTVDAPAGIVACDTWKSCLRRQTAGIFRHTPYRPKVPTCLRTRPGARCSATKSFVKEDRLQPTDWQSPRLAALTQGLGRRFARVAVTAKGVVKYWLPAKYFGRSRLAGHAPVMLGLFDWPVDVASLACEGINMAWPDAAQIEHACRQPAIASSNGEAVRKKSTADCIRRQPEMAVRFPLQCWGWQGRRS